MLKFWLICSALILVNACRNTGSIENNAIEKSGFLQGIAPFTEDSLVNVVIEISAGTNQKWEANKTTGLIEWQRVTPDSLRIIDYLAYPANYGFVPQTLLSKDGGGDGDPVDVFVLGPAIERESVASVRIIGIIHMLDDGESDSKLLAVDADSPVLNVKSLAILEEKYPGVVDIIKLWLLNYKGTNRIEILSVQDEKHATWYLKSAHNEYINMKHQ